MGIDWIGKSRSASLNVQHFIEGRFQPGRSTEIQKYSPRDGKLLCRFNSANSAEIDTAVASARRAFRDGRWSRKPVQQRREVLHRLAALIESHHEELALLECLDVGKPISDALNFDVPTAAALVRFNADAADKCFGKVYGVDAANLSYELKRPVGVVAAIVGWNFPLVLAAQKIAPVLATGNSIVLKPSELTSFSASRVAALDRKSVV